MIWPHGIQALEQWMNMINNYHQTIKFTYEYLQQEIPFLDTIVYKTEGNQLFTRVHHKPTDNKQYLCFHSAHPRKQKESVPYGLLIRSKRICSKQKYFDQEATNILQLRHRKYSPHLLEEAYRKVNNMRQDLLRPSIDKENTKLKLITNYNPNNPDLRAIIKKYEGLLLMTRKSAIRPEDIQVTYSRSPNIKDMIIKTGIIKQYTPKISQPCFKPRCKTCLQMDTTQTITNRTNHSYPIRGNFNCQSTNMVYVLKCMICGIQYVRESSNTMNTRCRGHVSTIRSSKDHPVAVHYRSYNHTTEDFSITIIDKGPRQKWKIEIRGIMDHTTGHFHNKRPKWQVVIPQKP